jgi:hypothetical protein
VAGLAIVLGGGAYLMATRDAGTETRDTSAVAPFAEPSSLPPSPVPAESPAATSPSPSRSASSPTPSAKTTVNDGKTVRREIEEAREKAAGDGHPLQRPLTAPAAPPVRAQDAGTLAEETRKLADGGTMRIISARYDLSSHREMLWAADKGEPYDDGVRCTQNFRFAENAKAAERPTMLLCWRNSAERSAVVLTVVKQGSPVAEIAAKAVADQWNKLG